MSRKKGESDVLEGAFLISRVYVPDIPTRLAFGRTGGTFQGTESPQMLCERPSGRVAAVRTRDNKNALTRCFQFHWFIPDCEHGAGGRNHRRRPHSLSGCG